MSNPLPDVDPLFTGDPSDDDAQVIGDYTRDNPTPQLPVITPTVDTFLKPVPPLRLVSDNITISGTEAGWGDVEQILGVDIHRKNLTLSLESMGGLNGLVNLVPRQLVNGAVFVEGSPVTIDPNSKLRLLLRTYSVAGTTKTILGVLFARYGGFTYNGNSLGTTGAVTSAPTGVHTVELSADTTEIIGALNSAGSSGDSVIDAQLDVFVTGSDNSVDYIRIGSDRNLTRSFRLFAGETLFIPDYTGEVYMQRGTIRTTADLSWLAVTK